uniref:Uncharacterized protein n=1 Tax=Vitis vinifera TaxID=29760 RepID=F6GWP7_VITVI
MEMTVLATTLKIRTKLTRIRKKQRKRKGARPQIEERKSCQGDRLLTGDLYYIPCDERSSGGSFPPDWRTPRSSPAHACVDAVYTELYESKETEQI